MKSQAKHSSKQCAPLKVSVVTVTLEYGFDQIAKNCYYTYLKKSTQTDSIDETELSELPSEEATAEEQLIRQDEASRIRAVLHTLPETYKEVFMWRVFAELSFSQIGQLFGKSDNWACVTYHRAKRMIQERLGDGTDEK